MSKIGLDGFMFTKDTGKFILAEDWEDQEQIKITKWPEKFVEIGSTLYYIEENDLCEAVVTDIKKGVYNFFMYGWQAQWQFVIVKKDGTEHKIMKENPFYIKKIDAYAGKITQYLDTMRDQIEETVSSLNKTIEETRDSVFDLLYQMRQIDG